MIEVKNISKNYGKNIVLDQLSFRVKKGEVLGILGENGAGKSSLLKVLAGLIRPDKGCVLINGYQLNKHTSYLQKEMGYLAQHNPVYEDMIVYEFLKFAANLHKIKTSVLPWKIKNVIKRCGLRSVLGQPISTLSKGLRQRVGLAQALIHDPDLLLLDEPTAGLDLMQIKSMQKTIKQVKANKTVIIATHRISEIAALCSKIIVLSKGCIIAEGPPTELSQRSDMIFQHIFLELSIELSKIKAFMKQNKAIHSFEIISQSQGYILVKLSCHEDIREWLWSRCQQLAYQVKTLMLDEKQLEDLFISLNKSAHASY
eukprot:COSAG01_NODE_398_length_17547_cov_206.793501_7_plen_314_part_00